LGPVEADEHDRCERDGVDGFDPSQRENEKRQYDVDERRSFQETVASGGVQSGDEHWREGSIGGNGRAVVQSC
jgi:hypothetical protein